MYKIFEVQETSKSLEPSMMGSSKADIGGMAYQGTKGLFSTFPKKTEEWLRGSHTWKVSSNKIGEVATPYTWLTGSQVGIRMLRRGPALIGDTPPCPKPPAFPPKVTEIRFLQPFGIGTLNWMLKQKLSADVNSGIVCKACNESSLYEYTSSTYAHGGCVINSKYHHDYYWLGIFQSTFFLQRS